MTGQQQLRQLVSTIDVHELHSIDWGPIRLMFPAFADDMELGRYLKQLHKGGTLGVVSIEPHMDANGHPSTHIFDVYRLDPTQPEPGA